MARRPLLRLLLVAVGVASGLVLAEGGARLLRPGADAELLFAAPELMPEGVYTPDEELFLAPTPGFQGRVQSIGYGVDLRFDTLGLRGDGQYGARRWLAVGDSFTLAAQVAEDDTFEARVGAMLGISVLNGGVDGYGTAQSTARYRRVGDQVDVEGVLLTFFLGNDLGDDDRWRSHPPGAAHPPPRVATNPWIDLLTRRSYLYAWYRVGRARADVLAGTSESAQRLRNELRLFTRAGQPEVERLVAQSGDALAALQAEAAARVDTLLVAVAPPAFALSPEAAAEALGTFGLVDPTPDAPRQALLRELRSRGIPTCDLTPALIASTTAPYFRYDGHWNAHGHSVVAGALEACLR